LLQRYRKRASRAACSRRATPPGGTRPIHRPAHFNRADGGAVSHQGRPQPRNRGGCFRLAREGDDGDKRGVSLLAPAAAVAGARPKAEAAFIAVKRGFGAPRLLFRRKGAGAPEGREAGRRAAAERRRQSPWGNPLGPRHGPQFWIRMVRAGHRGRTAMCGFFYLWESRTAAITGSTIRRVRCFKCDTPFEYSVTRTGWGGGHSPFLLTPSRAAADAKRRAYIDLDRELRGSIEAVYCPACGVFQPEMADHLRQRFGGHYDPNKFAAERLEIPFRDAWHRTVNEDSIQSYKHFMEVWPTALTNVALARARIRYLKHPRLLGMLYKTVPILVRTVWALAIITLIAFFTKTLIDR
jgi:hypothetical protein